MSRVATLRVEGSQTTPLRHSDMDLSFPIPVIGKKVALSTKRPLAIHFECQVLFTKLTNNSIQFLIGSLIFYSVTR